MPYRGAKGRVTIFGEAEKKTIIVRPVEPSHIGVGTGKGPVGLLILQIDDRQTDSLLIGSEDRKIITVGRDLNLAVLIVSKEGLHG
jgi:hypothetical protein